MDLSEEVYAALFQHAGRSLAVKEVIEAIADKIESSVRSTLNDLAKSGRVELLRGTNGHKARYGIHVERRI